MNERNYDLHEKKAITTVDIATFLLLQPKFGSQGS